MADTLEVAERLLAEGDDLAHEKRDAEALSRFRSAWSALPEPRDEQEPAVRILAAIADSQFHLGAWAGCRDSVQHAFRCGGDLANPFLRLRLGQALYEVENEQEAANWLVPAYLSEGRALFAEETRYRVKQVLIKDPAELRVVFALEGNHRPVEEGGVRIT